MHAYLAKQDQSVYDFGGTKSPAKRLSLGSNVTSSRVLEMKPVDLPVNLPVNRINRNIPHKSGSNPSLKRSSSLAFAHNVADTDQTIGLLGGLSFGKAETDEDNKKSVRTLGLRSR